MDIHIPNFVEELMYTCLNKRCQAPVIEYGHCAICNEIRGETIETIRKYLEIDVLEPVTLPD